MHYKQSLKSLLLLRIPSTYILSTTALYFHQKVFLYFNNVKSLQSPLVLSTDVCIRRTKYTFGNSIVLVN